MAGILFAYIIWKGLHKATWGGEYCIYTGYWLFLILRETQMSLTMINKMNNLLEAFKENINMSEKDYYFNYCHDDSWM